MEIASTQEPTAHEILEAIESLSRHFDERFNGVDVRFDGVDSRLDKVESRLDKVESRLDKVESRLDKVDSRLDKVESNLTRVGALMVTKDYLDDKLAGLRGDLVVLTRKEDTKLLKLLDVLLKKRVVSDDEAKEILRMEPFPHLI